MSEDTPTAAQGLPRASRTAAAGQGTWREVEWGEHDWQRSDPAKNLRCSRCGLYDGAWTGDPCPENPIRQRLHQTGSWEPFDDKSKAPTPERPGAYALAIMLANFQVESAPTLGLLVTDEDMTAARHAGHVAVDAVRAEPPWNVDLEAVELRAQLEAYGARLLARIGRTP